MSFVGVASFSSSLEALIFDLDFEGFKRLCALLCSPNTVWRRLIHIPHTTQLLD
jgi:hypothetical protein